MSELYIRQEVLPNLAKIDAILFDIDGVLLNVADSFRAATIDTIQYFAVHELGMEDTGKILEVEDIEAFKFAGGFNDDWDLTCAAAALVVGKWAQSGAKDTAALRNVGTTWKEFTDTLKRKGGGIVEAENFVLEMLNPTQRREFARNWNTRLVTRLFQEFYAGDDACKKLYGFEPETIHGHGYYTREVPLIDPVLTPPNLKLGVVTGRSNAEADLGLRHAKMFNRIKPVGWITNESGAKKPDGRTLMMARDALDFSFGLFIGDIMDDLNTVHNYRKLRGAGKARIMSAICLTGPGGETKRREFLEAGADIVAPDVNMLLEYLGNVMKASKNKYDAKTMSAKIVQINVNAKGGVPKLPVEQTRLGFNNVEGDKQRDKRYHGGPSRAVCLYSLEVIEALRAEGHPIESGWTGENLLVSGLDWNAMVPGVQLQIGAARVEITSYANPCKHIGYAFMDDDFMRIGQKKHPGWSRIYGRVTTEAEVKVGDEVRVSDGASA